MKQDSPSQTALFISKVMYLNSRITPNFVVPATQEIAETHVHDRKSSLILRMLLKTSWGCILLQWVQKKILPGFTSHVQRRKWWIYEYTFRRGLPGSSSYQLLVIGAGLDGLALEMSRQGHFQKIIEIDHPATQHIKKQMVSKSGIEFFALDLAKQSIENIKYHLLPDTPALVIWEGVSMYLEEDNVQNFLSSLSRTLPSSSELLWTYMVPDNKDRIQFHYGSGLIAWVLSRIREPFVWGVTSEKLPEFVTKCGWSQQQDISTFEVQISSETPCRGEKLSVLKVLK